MTTSPVASFIVVAQDPGVPNPDEPFDEDNPSVLFSEIEIPAERLAPGPRGHRVYIVDFDASTNTFYRPQRLQVGRPTRPLPRSKKRYKDYRLRDVLSDPGFHASQVYAIVMKTLTRFEAALGRRLEWGIVGHQLKAYPHGMETANAFYSADAEALVFGHFQARNDRNRIFTCLSHDIVVHETVHAILDGMRGQYRSPSSSDQAAFHEGFADVVAILSVLAQKEVLNALIDYEPPAAGKKLTAEQKQERHTKRKEDRKNNTVAKARLTPYRLKRSILLGLASEMGSELGTARGTALRRSVEISPDQYKQRLAEVEKDKELGLAPSSHDSGELVSAVILRAFIDAFSHRIKELRVDEDQYSRSAIALEGSEIADTLLDAVIRAIDFSPTVHLTFADYCAALLTADQESRPDDSRFRLRHWVRKWFRDFGIETATGAVRSRARRGAWATYQGETELDYSRSRFENMQSSRDEVFRWVWENRLPLDLIDAYTEVQSVRPSFRRSEIDGMPIRETVVEVVQWIDASIKELHERMRVRPRVMNKGQMMWLVEAVPPDARVKLIGGATLIFDEYGRLRYLIPNILPNPMGRNRSAKKGDRSKKLFEDRLESLWLRGEFVGLQSGETIRQPQLQVAEMHVNRSTRSTRVPHEEW